MDPLLPDLDPLPLFDFFDLGLGGDGCFGDGGLGDFDFADPEPFEADPDPLDLPDPDPREADPREADTDPEMEREIDGSTFGESGFPGRTGTGSTSKIKCKDDKNHNIFIYDL